MPIIKAADIADGIRVLTDDLATSLTRSIRKAIAGDIKAIRKAIRDEDFGLARTLVGELKFTDAIDAAEKRIRKFARAGAILGASAVVPPRETFYAQTGEFPIEVDRGAVRQITTTLKQMLPRDIRRSLNRQIDNAIEFVGSRETVQNRLVKQAIDPEVLANKINKQLSGEIYRVVEVGSNLTGTRVAAFGMLSEGMMNSIKTYRIDAVLDERTTEICRNMDGRVFQTEESYKLAAFALMQHDAKSVAAAHPFPTEDQAKLLSTEDLQDRGFSVPPFHFLCRSVVTLVSSDQVATQGDPINYALFEEPARNGREAEKYQQERWLSQTLPTLLETVLKYDNLDFKSKDVAGLQKEIGEALSESYNGRLGPAQSLEIGRDVLDELDRSIRRAGGNSTSSVKGVQEYTGGDYRWINQALRKNSEYALPRLEKAVRDLDKTFEVARLEEDIVVWRGVGRDIGRRMETGVVFQDDGFSSTSLSKNIAESFAGPDGALIQMIVPKGTPAIFVEKFTNIEGEVEMVLPRSSQFRIISNNMENATPDERLQLKVVWQGQGEKIDATEVGIGEKPPVENVVKTTAPSKVTDWPFGPEHPSYDKYVWQTGDIRFVPFNS